MKEYLTGSIQVTLTLDFQSEVDGHVDGEIEVWKLAKKLSRFMVCVSDYQEAHDQSDLVHQGNFFVDNFIDFVEDMDDRVRIWCEKNNYDAPIALRFYNYDKTVPVRERHRQRIMNGLVSESNI